MKENALTTKLGKRKDIERVMRDAVEEGTPLPGNKCECGGTIVKEVNGLFQGRYTYSNSHCNECGRVYLFAQNVHIVGYEEFNNIMNDPFTI